MVQIFQRESIFCSKISSGGYVFIKKLVPGGTNLGGGSIFTMTGPLVKSPESLLRYENLLIKGQLHPPSFVQTLAVQQIH